MRPDKLHNLSTALSRRATLAALVSLVMLGGMLAACEAGGEGTRSPGRSTGTATPEASAAPAATPTPEVTAAPAPAAAPPEPTAVPDATAAPTATPTATATPAVTAAEPAPDSPAEPETAAASPQTLPAASPLAEAAGGGASGEIIVELRLWQHVDDARDTWISARPAGGRWDTLGTIPFPLDEGGGTELRHFHTFGDLTIAGTELRLWQRYRAPDLIFVRACPTPCPTRETAVAEADWRRDRGVLESWPWQRGWNPLGMIPLPLDDGHSRSGSYRYGDLAVAVPVGNPGLEADREYLLALKDALVGTAELNWNAGTPTSEWDGVTMAGAPPRVTELQLAHRGLDGEIWGWLGDLTELRKV